MNEAIEKIVRAHVPEAGSAELSFIKFNTTGSPLRTTPNVLFFCFAEGRRAPSLCLKTVRAPRDNAVIAKAFADLSALNELAGTSAIVPRALWSGEVDGIMWSVEEAAPGRRPRAGEIPRVMDAYIGFQKRAGIVGKVSAREKAEALMRGLHPADAEEARGLCEQYCNGDVELVPQHGDFTPDNVLVANSRVTLVDCDSFMPEGIAGFDMYYFLSRVPQTPAHISEYLRVYWQALGFAGEFTAGDLLLWVMQERALKRSQGAPRDKEPLAAALERLRATFRL